MRLDHLLSKEEQVKNGFHCLVIKERQKRQRHKKQKTKDAADFTVSKTGQLLLVAMRLGDTPVPIPNTMVKT